MYWSGRIRKIKDKNITIIPWTTNETCQFEYDNIKAVIMYPLMTPSGGDKSIIDIVTDFYLAVLKVSTNKGT